MAPYTKPEALLKQAEGLISVSQPTSALQTLSEFLSSRKFRTTPLTQLEPIMLKFVDLCVDLRRGRTAKEGLMQYKNVAQNVNVASVEVVVRRFVGGADKKVREAKEKARLLDEKVRPNADEISGEGEAVDVDDLEASETPEGILLGAVSADQSKDRTDRALVTPWLKFLWEAYRTALETLKNNSRLEAIYQQIAQQAFTFCTVHQRKTEFRRLCETLRLHLSSATKLLSPPPSTSTTQHNPHAIDLRDPEVLGRYLETRFAQLNASVKLELWQEAFRSVEDVHGLLVLSPNGLNALKDSVSTGGNNVSVPAAAVEGNKEKDVAKDAKADGKADGATAAPKEKKSTTKAPVQSSQSMLASYYLHLARIFITGQNTLFHATALSRYFSTIHPSSSSATSTSGKAEEETKYLAGLVLLSALAVPISRETSGTVTDGTESDFEASGEKDGRELKGRNGRLVLLLGLGRMPSRRGLLKDALAKNIYNLAPDSIKKLYDATEKEFDPLNLVTKVVPILQELISSTTEKKEEGKEQYPSYASYIPLLIQSVLARLMAQLSQVYSDMKIDELVGMVSDLAKLDKTHYATMAPTSTTSTGAEAEEEKDKGKDVEVDVDVEGFLETFIIQNARRGDLNISIDHAKGVVKFVDDAYAYNGSTPPTPMLHGSSTSSTFMADTPIQPSVNDIVRTRLGTLATTLHEALFKINPPTPPTPEEQKEKFAALVAAANAERAQISLMLSLTSRRRDLLAELNLRREKEESVRKLEMAKKEKEEEVKRIAEEAKRKDRERVKREMEAIRREEGRKVREGIMGTAGAVKTVVGIGATVDTKEELSTDALMLLQVQQLEKEKKELAERLRIIAKRIDHTERAYRKEERPLLETDYEIQKQNDYAAYLAAQEAIKLEARKRHEEGLKSKERLSRIMKDGTFDEWKNIFEKKRGEEFEKTRNEARKKMEDEMARRRAKVLKQREEERKREEEILREEREREEEERRKEEERRAEEEHRAAEEAARIAAEESKKKEEEERLLALRQQREKERAEAAEKARLQQQREEEAMRRREERKKEKVPEPSSAWRRNASTSATPTPTTSTPPTPSRPSAPATGPDTSNPPSPAPGARSKYVPPGRAAGGTGGWRDREASKAAAGGGSGPGSGPGSGAASPRPASPAVAAPREKDAEDGFTTVQPKRWQSSRVKQQMDQQRRP